MGRSTETEQQSPVSPTPQRDGHPEPCTCRDTGQPTTPTVPDALGSSGRGQMSEERGRLRVRRSGQAAGAELGSIRGEEPGPREERPVRVMSVFGHHAH